MTDSHKTTHGAAITDPSQRNSFNWCPTCHGWFTPNPETPRLSWRTKAPQYRKSWGCGQLHEIAFAGTCEACGRSVYSTACIGPQPCGDTHEGDDDPRGVIPPTHCRRTLHASEQTHDYSGRDLVMCYACADDGDKYRSMVAAAKSSNTWTLKGGAQ